MPYFLLNYVYDDKKDLGVLGLNKCSLSILLIYEFIFIKNINCKIYIQIKSNLVTVLRYPNRLYK